MIPEGSRDKWQGARVFECDDAQLARALGNLVLRSDPLDNQRQFECAKAHFAQLNLEFRPVYGRPQDRVYDAVVIALEATGRKETVATLRALALSQLLPTKENDCTREFSSDYQELITDVADPECETLRNYTSDETSNLQMGLLSEALECTIQCYCFSRTTQKMEVFTASAAKTYEKTLALLKIGDLIMPVVAQALSAAAERPRMPGKPLLDLSVAERHQAIRINFVKCRTDEERRAFVQRVRESERARDIGTLVTHADWKAYAARVQGSELFRMYGEARIVAANYNALQAAHYYIAKLSNGSDPRACMAALLATLHFRITRGDSEEAVIGAFHKALSEVPQETIGQAYAAVRLLAADEALGVSGLTETVWKLASRLSIMHFMELHEMTQNLILPDATEVQATAMKFIAALLLRFGKSSEQSDREYHIMALMMVFAKNKCGTDVIPLVLTALADAGKIKPEAVALFGEALSRVWCKLMEKEDEAVQGAYARAIKGARELSVFTNSRALLIEAKTIVAMSEFKPAVFAGALVEAISAQNAASVKK